MEDNGARESIISYMDITLKSCHDSMKHSGWYEVNTKTDYDLWIVMDGEIKMIYSDKEYHLSKNDAFLLYPECLYEAFSVTPVCHLAFVHFDAIIGNSRRVLDAFPFSGRIPSEHIKKELSLFLDGYRSYKEKETLSFLYLKGCFTILLASIIRSRYAENSERDMHDPKRQSAARIHTVLDYISTHIDQSVSVKDLAAVVGMSEKYFISFFKDAVGITPASFMLQLRMKKAREFLYEDKYSIKEIADSLGYEDQYTFSKAFKKIYGVAPSKIV